MTVQSPDKLKEGPEDPWREAGCQKVGGRDRMVNDQLYGGNGSTFTLLNSQRPESSKRRRRNVTFLRLHTYSPH